MTEEVEKAYDEKRLAQKGFEPVENRELPDLVDNVKERKDDHSDQQQGVFGSIAVVNWLELREEHAYRDDCHEHARRDDGDRPSEATSSSRVICRFGYNQKKSI